MLALATSASRATDNARAGPLVVSTVALPGGASGVHADVSGRADLFLLDSGALVSIVTPATALRSGCHPWGSVTAFRATGERMDSRRCDGLRLAIGNRVLMAPTAAEIDLFAGKAITIRPLAHELVVETGTSLRGRTQGATQVPVRLVRDAQGIALSVDGAVDTAAGRAWLELDTGNEGPIMVDERVAAALGLARSGGGRQEAAFALVGGVGVRGPARVSPLIMDGDIGESLLGHWDVTFDLAHGRAWFRSATATATAVKHGSESR